MSNDTLKIKRKLSALTSSLDDLETSLTALLSQSLPELVLGLDTIQQAKLQVVVPYLVYDLVFVMARSLLKTRGLDPKTHPVIAELDRVRQYFDKLKDAQDPAKRLHTPTTSVPGPSAASHIRFDDGDNHNGGSSSSAAAHGASVVPAKMTAKMLEREKYHKALQEEDGQQAGEGGEEEVLEVFDEQEPDVADRLPSEEGASPHQVTEFEAAAGKGKGKAKAKAAVPLARTILTRGTAGKRRRPPTLALGNVPETGSKPSASQSGAKVRRIHIEGVSAEASSGPNTPSGGENYDKVRKTKKRSKKRAAP
ncbi:hypothetical protein BC826DRAFT_977107 [Russula brevipes]|nr:hypothetical protein BC826DRAFT_977107 [Russula brevipes]